MEILENKIPPPIVTLLFMIVMWFFAKVGFTFELGQFVRGSVVLVFFVLGVGFGILGLFSFKQAATTINPLQPELATSLVTSGIYRITRNPMYVGVSFCLLAWGVYLSSILALCWIPLFIAYITRFQIVPEERALVKKFGVKFENYKAKVRRWL